MDHVKHLKRHKNSLYSIVVILLVFQVVSLFVMFAKIGEIDYQQSNLQKAINENLVANQKEINLAKQELGFNILQVSQEVSKQKRDFQQEVNLIKAGQNDFSDVIENVVRGVVSVGTDKSAGTGFVIDSSGYIVTNNHVIDGATIIKVQASDGKVYDAVLVGKDSVNDIAVLKVSGTFTRLEFANSDEVQVGEKVIAIGNPLGLSFSVSEGIVSAVDRVGPNGQAHYIQTDVTLNPGNSGGPLIDKEGKVIGINNFKIGSAEGLGFALESNVIKQVSDSLLENVNA